MSNTLMPSITILYHQLISNQLNWILSGILLFLVYNIWNLEIEEKNQPKSQFPNTILFKDYKPIDLAYFNGEQNKPIYIAVKKNIYDVTNGRNFYGPGGPYENFAGRDASRGLAKNSFDLTMLTPFDAPIDKLENLDREEIDSLNDWEAHFRNKYTIVGKLIEP